MNKYKTILAALLFWQYSFAQWVDIPDQNFEQAFIDWGWDNVLDGRISSFVANNITGMNLANRNIDELTGIGYMVNLRNLNISNNNIDVLTLSENILLEHLNCSDNLLTEIDVQHLENLRTLNCFGNSINSIDVSNNFLLETLICSNNGLSNLVPSANINYLDATFNDLEELDISQCENLEEIGLTNNNLETINLDGNPILKTLEISNNKVNQIDTSNCPELISLHASHNNIEAVDVSQSLDLESLFLDWNELEEIDISNNLNLQDLRLKGNEELCCSLNLELHNSLTLFRGQNTSIKCIQVANPDEAEMGLGIYANWQKNTLATYTDSSCDEEDERLNRLPSLLINGQNQNTKQILSNYAKSINGSVNLRLYDFSGNLITESNDIDQFLNSNNYMSSGIYLMNIEGDNLRFSLKLLIK